MIKLNEQILNLEDKNEFFYISQIVNDYRKNNPDKKVLSLGIGDVSKPIIKPVIDSMHDAVNDLSKEETFKGYGASHGYDFLKSAILDSEYNKFSFTKDELYISNGTKTDSTSILELFDINSKIAIINPLYPIYKNGALCLNRNVSYLTSGEEDGFVPQIPKEKYDIIYICSPNNPTGIAYSKDVLKKWVDYAIENSSVILFDNVYHSFIRSEDIPKSIYEIDGAEKVAIEFRSFSKDISFTGVRCSYYIIPNKIQKGINDVWKKRTINRFNGADYIAQKGALALFDKDAQTQIKENIDYYMNNAKYIKEAFFNLGFKVYGGEDAPFLWVKINNNMNSFEFFKFFLEELNVIITPGIVFGKEGDKFFRVSSLGKRENIEEAIERIKKYYEKV